MLAGKLKVNDFSKECHKTYHQNLRQSVFLKRHEGIRSFKYASNLSPFSQTPCLYNSSYLRVFKLILVRGRLSKQRRLNSLTITYYLTYFAPNSWKWNKTVLGKINWKVLKPWPWTFQSPSVKEILDYYCIWQYWGHKSGLKNSDTLINLHDHNTILQYLISISVYHFPNKPTGITDKKLISYWSSQ